MTDLERVREVLRASGHRPVTKQALSDIDAHLEEDAARDKELSRYIVEGMPKSTLELRAELARLNESYDVLVKSEDDLRDENARLRENFDNMVKTMGARTREVAEERDRLREEIVDLRQSFDPLREAFNHAVAQRDTLLAALRRIAKNDPERYGSPIADARAAITEVEGNTAPGARGFPILATEPMTVGVVYAGVERYPIRGGPKFLQKGKIYAATVHPEDGTATIIESGTETTVDP